MTRRTLLLINRGSRFGEDALEQVREELERLGPLLLVEPDGPDDWSREIQEHVKRVEQVVVGGGDGTVNLALDGLIETGLPMGLLPLGTANDLARSLQIPEDLDKALAIIAAGQVRQLDVGYVNDKSFINAAGLGLGPLMTREMTAEIKSRWGVAAYLVGLTRAVRKHRAFFAEVSSDNRSQQAHFLQITVANGIHYGGGMTIADDARLDDGMLDVLLVRRQSRLDMMGNLLRLRFGKIRGAVDMTHWRCDQVRISTDQPMEVTADGELVARTPVVCHVRPGALGIFAPTDLT
jgi:diacylglycerol kinase (ATP)